MRLAIFFGILMLGFASSCTKETCGKDKDEFLTNYYGLVETASNPQKKPSASEWQGYDEQLRSFLEDCYPLYTEELSKGQRRTIWAKSTQYYYYRYGSEVLNALEDENNSVSRLISREVNARWDRPSEAIEEAAMSGSGNRSKLQKRAKE
jgi:hypothetical protein